MSQDIDGALQGWEFKPGVVQARLVQARDGRQVIQMRVDLGILQIETTERPDGARPHGCPTYFDYLRQQARKAGRAGQSFVLSEEQCLEADREFVQLYHRRICWLALRSFARAVADADHTLAFMDFVRDHSPAEEYTQAHEQYRGFVLFQRTQAAAARAVEKESAEEAIDEIRAGLEKMKAFFASFEAEEHMEEDAMVQQLRKMEKSLRETHGIEATLHEQLDEAVAKEDYETAARLRDALRRRPPGPGKPPTEH
jgi:hypothetical protein